MNKRGLIVLLVGINLFLLGAIVFSVYTPPSALAQAVGARRGEYLLISARAEATNDATYLIDSGTKKVHVFRSAFPRIGSGATDVAYRSTYDLTRDFVGPQGPGPGAGQPAMQGLAPGAAPGALPPPGGQRP